MKGWLLGALTISWGCGRVGFALTSDANAAVDSQVGSACELRLSAGQRHFAVLSDRELRLWGDNEYGQIGDASGPSDRSSPTLLAALPPVTRASAGRYHTCAVGENGTALCWGEGDSGQLGDGASTSSPTPVPVSNLTDVVETASAAIHGCARLGSGDVYCWGAGGAGRLGTGTTSSSAVPVQTNISAAKGIVAGGSTTFAILADDTVRCWGFNLNGGCGDSSTMNALSPVEPTGLGPVRSIAPRDRTTCAVRMDRTVVCFGANDLGQAGHDSAGTDVLQQTPVVNASGEGLVAADEVGQGIEHGCARIGGEVWCWGRNDAGQLGDGTLSAGHPYATRVAGLPDVVHLSVAAFASCAVTSNGDVYCWGENADGQLGNGAVGSAQPTPVLSFAGCP